MIIKTAAYFFIILTISSLITSSSAEDLPINIDFIGHRQFAGDAITTNANVDLFTQKSKQISELIAERKQEESSEVSLSLFSETSEHKIANNHQLLVTSAEEFLLFSEPPDYRTISTSSETNHLSLPIIILILIISAGSGYVLSRIIQTRKKEEK